MDYRQEYQAKLCTADEAAKLVKSGDWVDYGASHSFPAGMDKALARRKDELHGVKLRSNILYGPLKTVECDREMEHFIYHSWHCSTYERKLVEEGRAFFTPMVFRNYEWYYDNFLTVDVAIISVGPMDEEGNFNLAFAQSTLQGVLRKAKKIIVEINEKLPHIPGDNCSIHISRVDAIVESGENYFIRGAVPVATDVESRIAEHIFPYLKNGDTLQLGIGGTPNVLGELISQSDLKDLGMHTELCSDGYLALYKQGKLTNRCKNINNGVGVYAVALGSQELVEWLGSCPEVRCKPISYVNDPRIIAQHDNLISINGCLGVDLYGQVASEAAGLRHISGTGGQLDFITGATMSKGGKAFLCMGSTFTDKEGKLHSRIKPHFGGDIITTPRSQAYYIATEYGAVNLAGRTSWQRAEDLISIAHPDFRDELIKQAEAQRIWLPHNKR